MDGKNVQGPTGGGGGLSGARATSSSLGSGLVAALVDRGVIECRVQIVVELLWEMLLANT